MKVKDMNLYHIHRKDNMDDLWYIGNEINIDNKFNSIFYNKLLVEEQKLIKRYNNYDIDYIISNMEEMKHKKLIKDDLIYDFDLLLQHYYFLRREKALEEGRKIFNPNAPSRLHSIFLTDSFDINYWTNNIGNSSFIVFLLELNGYLFISSDKYFPNNKLLFENQVEESKKYWKPKVKTLQKEFLFKGQIKIIK